MSDDNENVEEVVSAGAANLLQQFLSTLGAAADAAQSDGFEDRAAYPLPPGWRDYPLSLPNINHVTEDCRFWRRRLADVGRHHVTENTNRVVVYELAKGDNSDMQTQGLGDTDIRSLPDMGNVNENPNTFKQKEITVFSIPIDIESPKVNAITLDGIRKVLSRLEVSPNILAAIFQNHTMGSKKYELRDSSIRREIWYSLPFPGGDDITQTVIWAEIESDAPRHPVLTFRTHKDFARRFKAFSDTRDEDMHLRPEDVHIMVLQTALQEWRDKLQQVTILAAINTALPFHEHNDSASKGVSHTMGGLFDTMGNLREYRLSLELLKSVANWLSLEFSPENPLTDTKGRQRAGETYFQPNAVCFELKALGIQFGNLLTVLDGIDQHVSQGRSLIVHRISLRNEETLVQNGLEMQRIAVTNEASGKEMAEIAKQSGEDARAMKVVSFVTMSYLPGTFIATFFSMQFVTLDTASPSALTFIFAKHIWIYFLATGVLTALTFGICLVYYSWEGIQERLKHTNLKPILSRSKTQSQPSKEDEIELEEVAKALQNRILVEERKDEERMTVLMQRIADYSNAADENGNTDEPLPEERRMEMEVAYETIAKELQELYLNKLQNQRIKEAISGEGA